MATQKWMKYEILSHAPLNHCQFKFINICFEWNAPRSEFKIYQNQKYKNERSLWTEDQPTWKKNLNSKIIFFMCKEENINHSIFSVGLWIKQSMQEDEDEGFGTLISVKSHLYIFYFKHTDYFMFWKIGLAHCFLLWRWQTK